MVKRPAKNGPISPHWRNAIHCCSEHTKSCFRKHIWEGFRSVVTKGSEDDSLSTGHAMPCHLESSRVDLLQHFCATRLSGGTFTFLLQKSLTSALRFQDQRRSWSLYVEWISICLCLFYRWRASLGNRHLLGLHWFVSIAGAYQV